ncbi:type VI secretion system tip protein TssI/VgrG [Oceanimonas sp. CHS3-5]|uniref:type VI secretion system Vgr family protein n=1 Tax=Oceanimonas sp. CHS3-5 TaxID=3068186 RepID=UPI00273EBF65|nr:type VI secretion system tip protein TssI/VgrG [Oceanimonas sp. CHS3-5]MDP5291715.1 type VI secretion system tip protein TssI/VgrG [Oceanimonas sp. CHS3-5]
MNTSWQMPGANAHQAWLHLGELGAQSVYEWQGDDALSRCFSLSVTLVCSSPLPPLGTLLQQPAALVLHSPKGTQRYVHGLVFELSELDRSPRHLRYQLTVVPPLALLNLRRGVRIFQGQSVPDIVERLLTEAGLGADTREWRLNRDHAPRDYCVQYNETELAFIERLLGEEGIHYHFVHRAEDTLLVLADGPEGLDTLPPLPFKADTGMAHDTHAITRLSAGPGVRTGKVSLRDYDFTRPALPLQPHSQHLPGPDHADEQPLEDYRWPGSFLSQARGKQLTDLSLARYRHDQMTVTGASDSPQLMAGHYQPLKDHPNPEHNQLWLITQLRYQGKQPQVLGELADGQSEFHCEFTALPEASVYRPPCPPKPRVPGQQSAIVTGPAGEEIYCDEYGRVKVQFYWDRHGLGDENTSTWLRVSQGWAGNGYGQFMLPRVGMEVLVSFINGDPDRPIITGCLYNGANRVPYALPEHKTRSTFKTASSPGSDNANELRFEDKAGQEQIYLHAAKDYDQLIDHNKKTEVLNDQHTDTHGHHYGRTRGDHHHTVNGQHHSRTDGDRHEQVGGSRHTELGNQELLKAGREIHLAAGQKMVLDAGTELTLNAGGSMIKLDPSGITLLGPAINMNAGGSPGKGSGVAAVLAGLPVNVEQLLAVDSSVPLDASPAYEWPAINVKAQIQALLDGKPVCAICKETAS